MKSLGIFQSLPRRTVLQDGRVAAQVSPPLRGRFAVKGNLHSRCRHTLQEAAEATLKGVPLGGPPGGCRGIREGELPCVAPGSTPMSLAISTSMLR